MPTRSTKKKKTQTGFLAYPRALNALRDRLGASPEELAAWVFLGSGSGGLAAYLNANRLTNPPRFLFNAALDNNPDFLSPLMACWFRNEDIARFHPILRFITGEALIARWSQHPGLEPKAFIQAKVAESRLSEVHPISGGTQATFPGNKDYPSIQTGLFVLSNVEEIERTDLSMESGLGAMSVGSREWLSHIGRKGALAKHLDNALKRKAIGDLWMSGKFTSKDACAEQECAALGMSMSESPRVW